MAKEFTAANFESEVLKADKPVLVDFWAPWCGPCKAINPILEELSVEMKNKLIIGKVNIEQDPEIAGRYGIMSVPTLIIIRKGEVVGQVAGAQSKKELQERITVSLEN